MTREEGAIRLYLYYLFLACALDSAFLGHKMLSPCNHLEHLGLAGDTRAFACGVARITDLSLAAILLAVQLYALHIVHSLAEEFHHGLGVAFDELGYAASKRCWD